MPGFRREGAFSAAMTTRGTQRTTRHNLQIAEDLRPDGDHADEQRQGRERGGFLDNGFDHGISPLERTANIVHVMF